MREIKLRAFDKKRGYILPLQDDPNYLIGIDDKGRLYLIRDGNRMKDEEYEFIRFTGLLDKSGREIYEGDILQVTETLRAVVEWVPPSFGFKLKRLGTKHIYFDDIDMNWPYYEVIGNQFENPERKRIRN